MREHPIDELWSALNDVEEAINNLYSIRSVLNLVELDRLTIIDIIKRAEECLNNRQDKVWEAFRKVAEDRNNESS